MASIAPTIAMLAAIMLIVGGIWLIVKSRDRRRGLLMLAAALVLIANVVIWTI